MGSGPNGEWTKEDAAAAGRKGAEKSVQVRQERAAMRADARALAQFAGKADVVAKALLDAALGQGEWHSLELKDRIPLLKVCLEYGVGRPRQTRMESGEETDEPEARGIAFGTGIDVQVEDITDDPEVA